MPDNLRRLFYFSLLCMLSTISVAQSTAGNLRKNPFSQPESLKAPAQRVAEQPDRQSDQPVITNFILSATLISVNEPMAVVNGELLTMDEETNGMRLILVDDGRAVIRYEGKLYDLSLGETSQQPPEKRRR